MRNRPTQCGFNNLDTLLMGGVYPGLYVVGAISSLGKTTFVLQLAETFAKQGKQVLFVSLEMSRLCLIKWLKMNPKTTVRMSF